MPASLRPKGSLPNAKLKQQECIKPTTTVYYI